MVNSVYLSSSDTKDLQYLCGYFVVEAATYEGVYEEPEKNHTTWNIYYCYKLEWSTAKALWAWMRQIKDSKF